MPLETESDYREKQKTYFEFLERALSLASQCIPSEISGTPYAEYSSGRVEYGYKFKKVQVHSPPYDEDMDDDEYSSRVWTSETEERVHCGYLNLPPRLRNVAEGKD